MNEFPAALSYDSNSRKHQEILKLISLYKENNCLWDINGFGNCHDRKNAYKSIAKQMFTTSENVKSKLKSLRAQYRRELARQQRLNTQRPKWIYFRPLEFLRPSVENANRRSMKLKKLQKAAYNEPESDDLPDSMTRSSQTDCDDDNDDKDEVTKINEHNQSRLHEEYQQLQNDDKNYTAEKAETVGGHKPQAKRVLVIPRQPPEVRDQYTILGEHVANELRLLEKHKDLQKVLKCTILESILEANRAGVNSLNVQLEGGERILE